MSDNPEQLTELISAGVLPNGTQTFVVASGGTTDSRVYGVQTPANNKYAIKIDITGGMGASYKFLDDCRDLPYLPQPLWVSNDNKILIYSFIEGKRQDPFKDKKELMLELSQKVFSQYREVGSPEVWGHLGQPAFKTWADFIVGSISRTEVAKKLLSENSKDHVVFLVKKVYSGINSKPYLIHGDCGAHNLFFKSDGSISGVIDPCPILGLPEYDLMYAYCSESYEFNVSDFREALEIVRGESVSEGIAIEVLTIGLYQRIDISARVHPEDLDRYVVEWKKITNKKNNKKY